MMSRARNRENKEYIEGQRKLIDLELYTTHTLLWITFMYGYIYKSIVLFGLYWD